MDRQTERLRVHGCRKTKQVRGSEKRKRQKVTRGHNIVADRWAGPTPIHTPYPTQPLSSHPHICIRKASKTLVFPLFDRQTDGRTDKASYRVACPQTKKRKKEKEKTWK